MISCVYALHTSVFKRNISTKYTINKLILAFLCDKFLSAVSIKAHFTSFQVKKKKKKKKKSFKKVTYYKLSFHWPHTSNSILCIN